jgi:hypothetical protein
MVERAFIYPPHGQIGPITPQQREQIIKSSLVYGTYETAVDRESAYEKLKGAHAQPAPGTPTPAGAGGGFLSTIFGGLGGGSTPAPRGRGRQPDSLGTMMAKSAARTIGSSVGREIVRGVLGSIFGGRRR